MWHLVRPVICLYEEVDSAKNFGIDVMAGVRYMFTQTPSPPSWNTKYNHHWAAEIEAHPFYLPDGNRGPEHGDSRF